MIRRSLRWFCVVVVLSMPGTAGWPSGTVSISGSLTSITENQYVVETPNSVYYIKKSAVTPTEAAKLTQTEVPVTVTVPFSAVLHVKSKKKAATP